MIISVCGKGGSGKSVLTALVAHALGTRGYTVLVVDADESNSGLYRYLGVEKPPKPLMELLGGKEAVKGSIGNRDVFSEPSISIASLPDAFLTSAGNLRLAAIGKIHQALEGCACPMGVLNREFLKKLTLGQDEIAVVDMEAGVEHFGRGIEEAVDSILLVVEPSMESISLAERIQTLAAGMGKSLWAVLNKIGSESIQATLQSQLDERGIRTAGVIPDDPSIFEACLEGRRIDSDKAFEAVSGMVGRLLEESPGEPAQQGI